MLLTQSISNILRANYSTQVNKQSATLDTFGGGVPPSPSLLLGTLSPKENEALFGTFGDVAQYQVGGLGKNQTRQVNVTDSWDIAAGSHQLKFGGDYRVIFLDEANPRNLVDYLATDIPTFLSTGSVFILAGSATHPSQFLVQSLSLYAQDTWKVRPRLTLTYGLRWELNPAPSARGNTTLAAWQNVNDPANIALAPQGTALWSTTYGNVAPRFGIAYSLTPNGDLVVRGGGGIFYDLGVGSSAVLASFFPNTALAVKFQVPVPVADISPFLPSTFSRQPPFNFPTGFDPNLVLPRSYQWNVAIEKSFGGTQAVSATYLGQAGRDQLRREALQQPNPNFTNDFFLTRNSAYSNYNALQVQFRRKLSSGLQALLNYTWSHSLDNAADDVTIGLPGNVASAANDYASSSFDVRHSFSGAISYDLPAAAKSGARPAHGPLVSPSSGRR